MEMDWLVEGLWENYKLMIAYLRSTDCHPDSRLQKYTDYLSECGYDYFVVGWDRYTKLIDDQVYTYYHKKCTHGQGIKNLFAMLGFNWFVLKYLWKNRNNYRIIHACDFDTILPAIIIKIICGKKVVYDIFDWFVDSRNFNNYLLKKIILFFEKIVLKKSDIVIICDEERKTQLPIIPEHLWILPNIPNFCQIMSMEPCHHEDELVLSYVGVLAEDRGLTTLIETVKQFPNIKLNIAGFGILESYVRQSSEQHDNIIYYGSVPYNQGLSIMQQADLIVAFYEKRIKNNLFAAPNKYYEGLYLGKPLLTTAGTAVGAKSEMYKTGFAIEEDIDSLVNFLKGNQIKDKLQEYGINAQNLWQKQYVHYVNDFMQNYYLKLFKL